MGVNYGKDALHSVIGLTMADVGDMCKGLASERDMRVPTIDVDCSNAGFKVGDARSVANLLVKWSKIGARVVPVCDGKRPDAKQATNERRAKREKNRIKAYLLRKEILSLQRRLKQESLTDSDKNDIREIVARKQRSMKSKETQSRNVIQSNFEEKLKEELKQSFAHSRDVHGGSVADVVEAEFQADAVMMGRIVSQETLMVLTTDADIPIIAGDTCIAVKQFTSDGSIEIVCTCKETLDNALKYLSEDAMVRATVAPAAYPIFDGVSDRKLRALMAIFLGCDVYAKGMVGVGVSTLSDIINVEFPQFQERCPHATLFAYLKKYLYSKTDGFDHEIVRTYIRAIVYEPTNVAPEVREEQDSDNPAVAYRTYLDEPPTSLPKYLEEFALEGHTEIIDGPEMQVCKGVGAHTHPFLSADGYETCMSCGEIVCRHCREEEEEEERTDDEGSGFSDDTGAKKKRKTTKTLVYCLPCYAAEKLVPEKNVEGGRALSEMREELATVYGVEKAKELTIEEVEDLYALKEVATARLSKMFDAVPFPKHATSEMDADTTEVWDTLMDINFGEGGAFISDPDLDPIYLPGILELFSSLVRFESAVRTDWVKDPAVYDAMPAMFIDFAQKSRVDNGYRLIMRCVRHAFDSRCKSIDDCTGSLIQDKDGKIGIRLGTNVPASMKKNIYETHIVATAKDLLCSKCTCQCGSQGKERIVCVHTLVVLYLLTMLLIEDLAEHLLISLAARVDGSINDTESEETADEQWRWNTSTWSEDEVSEMKAHLVTLMEAAGETVSVEDASAKSLPELLQSFVVGTERRKEWKERSKLPPKPSELGPVADVKFHSTSRRAKLATRRGGAGKATETSASTAKRSDRDPITIPFSDPDPSNAHLCAYPNCTVDADTEPPLERIECKGEFCSRLVHRLCQFDCEAGYGLVHEENEPYCPGCHPKSADNDASDEAPPVEQANFDPDYLKVLAFMKAAGCDMDDSNCVGHRLIAFRGVQQLQGQFGKQTAVEKEAAAKWKTLVKSSETRSLNATASQMNNLTEKASAASSHSSKGDCVDASRAQSNQPGEDREVSPPRPRISSPLHRPGMKLPTRLVTPAPLSSNSHPKKRRKLVKCHKVGCNRHNNRNGMKGFRRIPIFPQKLKSKDSRSTQIVNYYGRVLLRKEILRRMGLSENDERRDLFICLHHKFEAAVKSIEVTFGKGQKPVSRRYKLLVPEACGPESSLRQSTSSKGLGFDRDVVRRVAEITQTIEEGHVPPDFSFEEVEDELASAKPETMAEMLRHSQEEALVAQAKVDALKADLAREKLGRSQDWEHNSNEQHVPINPVLKRATGMDVHRDPAIANPPAKGFFTTTPIPPKRKHKKKGERTPPDQRRERHENVRDPPKVTPLLDDEDVKRRTGFPTMQHLLAYVFVVCNGDVDAMAEKRTVLTWFEEWFMHFEFKWGRTTPRIWDVSKTYGPIPKYVRRAINLKYNIERRARNSWPTYASYEEDKELRNNEKWDEKYGGMRPVMWDMTNIPAYGFSDADFNRLTYSKYYAENCFKGGVGTQLCGWILTAPLWMGAVSDTDYNKRAGYLQEQEQFQSEDLARILINGTPRYDAVPFTNIYDKGYRAKLVAWRLGKQRVLQPVWADSDRRFGRDDTLLTASVAADRGANERAVNMCKRSWFVSRGFQSNSSPSRLNDAWMTWSFQTNFMYNPVL